MGKSLDEVPAARPRSGTRLTLSRSMQRLLAFVLFTTSVTSLLMATPLKLVEGGKALLPIVIASGATEETRAAGKTLAAYLQRMNDATFAVQEGDGTHGIVLGTAAEFSELANDPALTSKAIVDREN